jgi:lipopolysaccharide/colanic/teichoic acid biosynthesis glycosyltransferase
MNGTSLPKAKRIFDLVFSIIALVLLVPLFVLVGLLIKLCGRGPVFFKQKRIGKNGKPFILYKFRTMHVLEDAGNVQFEPGNISRVTSIGKVLRKTKVDEFPQLINVLKGDMSLVGPRPEVEKWVAVYPERWKKILSVPPGITDNASIEFRHEEDLLLKSHDPEKLYKELVLPVKLLLYEFYVDHHSFFGDIKIMVKTIFCLFKK